LNDIEQSQNIEQLRFDSDGWQILCQPEEARLSFSYQGRLWLAGATFSLASGYGLVRPQDCGRAEGKLAWSATGCSYTITYAGNSKTALSLRLRTSPDVPGIFLKMAVRNDGTEPLTIFGFNIIEALGGKASFWPGYGGTNGAVFDWGFQSLSPAKVRRPGDSYASGINEHYLQFDPGVKPFGGQNQFISSWICELCAGTGEEKALLGYVHPKDQSGYFLYRRVDRSEDFLARSDAEGRTLEAGGVMSSEELYITLGKQEERLVSELFSLKDGAMACREQNKCDTCAASESPRAGLRVHVSPHFADRPEGYSVKASIKASLPDTASYGFCDTIFLDADLIGDFMDAYEDAYEADAAGVWLKEAAVEIKAAGYRPALWWSPFAAYRDGAMLKNKPQWALQCNGKMVPAGKLNGRKLAALDVTNPEVVDYLSAAARRISEDWGYHTVVLDRLYLAALVGERHDAQKTRIGAFHAGLSAIRSALPFAFLIGRGCPFWPTAGLLNAVDIGAENGNSSQPRNRSLFPFLRKKPDTELQPLSNLILRSPAGGVFWKSALRWQASLWERFTPKTAAALAAFGGEVVIFEAQDENHALISNAEFREIFTDLLHAPKQHGAHCTQGTHCTPGPGWMTTSAIKSLIIKSEQCAGLLVLVINTGNAPEEVALDLVQYGFGIAEGDMEIQIFDRFTNCLLATVSADQCFRPQEMLAPCDSWLFHLVPKAEAPVTEAPAT